MRTIDDNIPHLFSHGKFSHGKNYCTGVGLNSATITVQNENSGSAAVWVIDYWQLPKPARQKWGFGWYSDGESWSLTLRPMSEDVFKQSFDDSAYSKTIWPAVKDEDGNYPEPEDEP